MPKLHPNEISTRKISEDIANALGLPNDLVRTVIDCLGYYILHQITEEGIRNKEIGDIRRKIKVEIPMIGTLELMPKKYPTNEKSILDGWALRSSFTIREQFLEKARQSYYAGDDYLVSFIEENFNRFIKDKYQGVILKGDDADE